LFLDPDDLLRPTALEKLVLMATEVINVGSKDKDRGGSFTLRTGLTPLSEKTNPQQTSIIWKQSQASCSLEWSTLVTSRT